LPMNFVGVKNESGGYEATRHLVGLGHEIIGCVSGPQGASNSDERVAGYRRALTESGLEVNEILIRPSDWTIAGSALAAKELLSLKMVPTAVFLTSDACALGVFEVLATSGRMVPADIAIVGFDDTLLAAHLRVPLTTVKQPIGELAKACVELLFQQLEHGGDIEPRSVELDVELIVRESCGSKLGIESRPVGIPEPSLKRSKTGIFRSTKTN